MDPASRTATHFEKTFDDLPSLELELAGYHFFKQHYPRVPRLIAHINTPEKQALLFENLTFLDPYEGRILAEFLDQEKYPPRFPDTLREMFELANKHAKQTVAGGGSSLYYHKRTGRLQRTKLQADYAEFHGACQKIKFGSGHIDVEPRLLELTVEQISSMRSGLCTPSQGDFHERNVFCNGYIVDFEASGWNLLSTDIATFLYHTLFVGDYYGPKFAIWATAEDRQRAQSCGTKMSCSAGELRFELSPVRMRLMEDYQKHYLLPLELFGQLQKDIGCALVFRLLTVIDPLIMGKEDRQILYGLANYFYPGQGHYDIFEKLSGLLADNTSSLAASTKASSLPSIAR